MLKSETNQSRVAGEKISASTEGKMVFFDIFPAPCDVCRDRNSNKARRISVTQTQGVEPMGFALNNNDVMVYAEFNIPG
jgi:hypothetical protein